MRLDLNGWSVLCWISLRQDENALQLGYQMYAFIQLLEKFKFRVLCRTLQTRICYLATASVDFTVSKCFRTELHNQWT